jgi:type I restriction enzyme R subunit
MRDYHAQINRSAPSRERLIRIPQTCHLIVLDRGISSMTEFKQIIGRGTRINEDYGKLFFTIMDFKRATALFADPDFDGDPVQIFEPGENDPIQPPEDEESTGEEIVDPPGGAFVDPPPTGAT